MKIDTSNGHTILADDADYELLGQYSWYGRRFKNTAYAYAREKGQGRVIAMHRLLMQPEAGFVVHHRNNNGLDNRRENLQVTTTRVNIRHVFIAKKCPSCSDPIDEWWSYCAMCGWHLAGGLKP